MSIDMYIASMKLKAKREKESENNTLETDRKLSFRLKEQDEDFVYNPEKRKFTFYQICQFAVDKQYHIRKIIYDEMGEMISHKEAKLKKIKLEKFLKGSPKYKYTLYPAYNLDIVGYPQSNEVLMAKSQLLNNY
jgi:hypothetical protein